MCLVLGEICVSDKASTQNLVVGQNVSTPIARAIPPPSQQYIVYSLGNRQQGYTYNLVGFGRGQDLYIDPNLAMTYALMGKKVVVVGFDLRRPMLAHSFGFSNQKGVTTYLERTGDRCEQTADAEPRESESVHPFQPARFLRTPMSC